MGSRLRLRDRIGPGLRVLFVGINPGVRSAITVITLRAIRTASGSCCGRRGWFPSGLLTSTMTGCAEWGYGITNLVPRPTPGIDDLRPAEYVGRMAGARTKDSVDSSPASSRSSESRFTGRSCRTAREREWGSRRAAVSGADRWASSRRRSTGRACSWFPIRAAATPTSATRRCWARSRNWGGTAAGGAGPVPHLICHRARDPVFLLLSLVRPGPVSEVLSRLTSPHDVHEDTKPTMVSPAGFIRVHRVIVFVVNPGRRRVQRDW